jgi:formylglycine-generating enzyme required for sulfatase activity
MRSKAQVIGCFCLISCSAPPPAPGVECHQTIEGCDDCGGVGCPCFDDDSCDQGTCSEAGTCVRAQHDMVFVPAGPFWMGCREGFDADEVTGPCPDDELPYRQVTLNAYWIDRTEVRKADYRRCIEAGVCSEPSKWDLEHWQGTPVDGQVVAGPDDFPAASLSWTQAKTFCEWTGKRLPTEAEWEKAARGTDGRKYPWGNDEPRCGHGNFGTDYDACDYNQQYYWLTPVGMLPGGMSPYGALDMAGNVKEWTADGFDEGVGYHDLPTENPTGVESEIGRAFRGGGYQSPALALGGYVLRTSIRGAGRLTWTNLTLEYGVRCAADSPVAGAVGHAPVMDN